MTEHRDLPATVIVPSEFKRLLADEYNVNPERSGEYFTFALFIVFRQLSQELERRSTFKREFKRQPEWLPLALYLQTLFGIVTSLEQTQEPKEPKEKRIVESKPSPSEAPLYDDLTEFQGKPITKRFGPYALPTVVFNSLTHAWYNATERPSILMADELAKESDASFLKIKNIGEDSLKIIKELLERIKFEAEGSIEGSPFLTEIPSMYCDAYAKPEEFSEHCRYRLTRIVIGKNENILEFINNGERVALYPLACLTEASFEQGPLKGHMVEIKEVLQRHSHDIYLKK